MATSGGVPTFRVPRYGLAFPSEILARSLDLIGRGIWSGINQVRFRRWMKNFTTDEEKYFAACVIDALIYRSDEQTTALVAQLFQRSLIDLARLDPLPVAAVDDWVQRLRDSSCVIRLVPAVKNADYIHKSAPLVSRLLKRQFAIRPQWIVKPWELRQHVGAGAKVLVFIDDFLATGQQFEDFIVEEKLEWIFGEAYVIYAPFVAHENGIGYLRHKYKHLRVTAAEVLDGRHELLNPVARAFDDGVNTPEAAREFYLSLLDAKGIRMQEHNRFGFGGLALTYVFKHAVPDNDLPLLWYPGASDWLPLFDR